MSKRRREVAFVETERSRMVTFSKRRKGLFKKASELCVLCGAQVAIITFSPNGRPFVFGHDSVDEVLSRYLPADSPAEKEVMLDSGSGFDALMHWIEDSIKHCETPEDLRSLIQLYTHLLEQVKGRIEDMESSQVAIYTDSAPSMDEIFEIVDHEEKNKNPGFSSYFASLDDSIPSMDEIFDINLVFSNTCTSLDDSNPSVDDISKILNIVGEEQNSTYSSLQVSDYGMQSSSFVLDTGCSAFFTGFDDSTPAIDDIFERVGGENQQPTSMIQDQPLDNECWVYDVFSS